MLFKVRNVNLNKDKKGNYYNHTQKMNANQNTQQGTFYFNEMSEEWIFQQFIANPSEGATNTFTNSNSRDNGNDSQITSDLLAGILDNSTDNVHDMKKESMDVILKKEINIVNIVSSNVLNVANSSFFFERGIKSKRRNQRKENRIIWPLQMPSKSQLLPTDYSIGLLIISD
ncbi:hypothetical protein Avbf_11459 [Armadillidium vulgare]|nr:hypothetical protein Avbf_11459 [Armadillidium vulgare]